MVYRHDPGVCRKQPRQTPDEEPDPVELEKERNGYEWSAGFAISSLGGLLSPIRLLE
jgi:hypothetical protein